MPRPGHSWWKQLCGSTMWGTAMRHSVHSPLGHAPARSCPTASSSKVRGQAQQQPSLLILTHCRFSSSFQTAHTAGDWLTARTGSLCMLSREPCGVHHLMKYLSGTRCWCNSSKLMCLPFPEPLNQVHHLTSFKLVNLGLGYSYCLNKEHKMDASPEASVRASLETESNIFFCPHWIKQGETHPT